MTEKKSYKQLNQELSEIIARLDQEIDDIDKAIELHKKGEKIITQLEEYLKETKSKIDLVKQNKK